MRPEVMWTTMVSRVLRPAVRSELMAAVVGRPESMGTELRPARMVAVMRWPCVMRRARVMITVMRRA